MVREVEAARNYLLIRDVSDNGQLYLFERNGTKMDHVLTLSHEGCSFIISWSWNFFLPLLSN